MTERLSLLLRDTADPAPAVDVGDVAHRVVRRRRRQGAAAALALAAVASAVVVPLTARTHHARLAVGASPDRSISLDVLSFDLPVGWSATRGTCNPGGLATPETCPKAVGPRGEEVTLLPSEALSVFFEENIELGPCRRDVAVHVDGFAGVVDRKCGGAPASVSFDLLDASADVRGADPSALPGIVAALHIAPAATLEVPASAHEVTVLERRWGEASSAAPHSSTDPAKIHAVLAALAGAPQIPRATPVCDGPTLAWVTIDRSRTYAVGLVGCDQVVAGNGTLAQTTPQLRAALAAVS